MHINGRAITEKSPKHLFLPLLQGKSAKTPIQPFSFDSYESRENRDTDLPTRIKSSLEVLTGIQLVWGTRNIPRSQEKPQKSKKNGNLHFLKKTKTKWACNFTCRSHKNHEQHTSTQNPYNTHKYTPHVLSTPSLKSFRT